VASGWEEEAVPASRSPQKAAPLVHKTRKPRKTATPSSSQRDWEETGAVVERQHEVARVRLEVDRFLAALPLGDEHAVEAAVGRRMFKLEREAFVMRKKLNEW
jgi:hypothetical protein